MFESTTGEIPNHVSGPTYVSGHGLPGAKANPITKHREHNHFPQGRTGYVPRPCVIQ